MVSSETFNSQVSLLQELEATIPRLKSKVSVVKSSKPKIWIERIEIKIPHIDPLSWLDFQENPTKVYWSDRENEFEMAGVGTADSVCGNSKISYSRLLASIGEKLESCTNELRYYGGISFTNSQAINGYWKEFGNYRFILPKFELVKKSNLHLFLACNFLVDPSKNLDLQMDDVSKEIGRLTFDNDKDSHTIPPLLCKRDEPDRNDWINQVQSLLTQLDMGNLQKIVLARKSILQFKDKPNPLVLLKKIRGTSAHCFHFCFQINEDLAFIGASPERLFKRAHRHLYLEALAGTRNRGNSPQEDQNFGLELIESEKDIHEHSFVVSDLKRSLEELGCSAEVDSRVSLLKLNRLQHLYLDIQSELPSNKNDADVLRSLHPTSAVGGTPVKRALEILQETEPFERGWYAGPVGWLGKDESEFAVGIRSGVVVKNRMEVYSGAGIVRGSNPEEEWQEVENKYDSFIGKILN